MLKEMTNLELQYQEFIANIDGVHSAILEGYWNGFNAYEIAEMLGEDVTFIATTMDAFRDLGY